MKLKVNKVTLINARFFLPLLLIASLFAHYGCSKQDQAGGGFSMPPMPVETAQVKSEKVADQFKAVGTIEAIEAITVVSEIDAIVEKLPFEEGSLIKKGAVIAQLDDSQLAAELSRNQALYEQSKTTYTRIKNIVDQRAGTLQDLDDAFSALKVAEANLALAKARFSKTRIIAPFDGIIGSRRVSVGSFLRTGQTITEFANINEIRVNFSAPERYLSQLRRGADVNVSTSVYTDHTVKGKIIVIEPVLDPETRNVRIVARVSNPGRKFLPGMSANIAATLSERAEATTIPSEAIFAEGDQSFVFVVGSDSSVVRSPVKLGLQLENIVEIVDGLKPGQRVVVAGHQKLFDHAKVIPIGMNDSTMKQ